jgi:hypothetical protein
MNNFDISSTGVNLELSCFFDADASRINFEEHFKVIQHSSYSKHQILAYKVDGVDVDSLNKEYDINVDTRTLFKLYANHYFDKDFSVLIPSEIRELFETLKFHDSDITPLRKCSIDDLKNAIYCDLGSSQEELENFLENHFEPTFQVIESRGYCQGDYSKVIFFKEVLDYIRSEYPDNKDMTDEEIVTDFKSHVDNLIWDSQLYCKLNINGENEIIQLDEYLSNSYEHKTDEIIEGLKKDFSENNTCSEFDTKTKDYIIEWLSENLPDQPDYH